MSESHHAGAGRMIGKVVLVTGAGAGIGRAEALLFAAEGAHVVVNDLDVDSAAAVTAAISSSGGRAVASNADVGAAVGAQEAVAAAVEAFGGLDVLVNNAGIFRPGDLATLTDEDWDEVLRVNLSGAFRMIRSAVPTMTERGGGVILNTSSTSGLGHAGMANYAAAKEGLIGLTRSAARELGRFSIRCNAIRPIAMTATARRALSAYERWAPLNDAIAKRRSAVAPRRDGPMEPEHVAALAVWLCSDRARSVNGRTVYVAGGQVGLYPEPQPLASMWREQGWTIEALDRVAGTGIFAGLTDDFDVEVQLPGDPQHAQQPLS